MQLYTVHQGPAPASGGDDVVFVLDGFSWVALIVPPLWALFREFGSYRVMFMLAEVLGIGHASPPRPILPLPEACRGRVQAALEHLVDVVGDRAESPI